MSQPPFVRPPRIAGWLIDLVTSSEQAESIRGDLLEEFSALTSKSGVACARRWYWRQSVKTIAHMTDAGFRSAPWLILSIVFGGLLLWLFVIPLSEKAAVAIIDSGWHGVVPYYTDSQMRAHLFWLNGGLMTGRLVLSLLVGCICAIAAKGKEMLATTTLGIVLVALLGGYTCVQLTRHWAEGYAIPIIHAFFTLSFPLPIMIVAGGVIVRIWRRRTAPRTSAAA